MDWCFDRVCFLVYDKSLIVAILIDCLPLLLSFYVFSFQNTDKHIFVRFNHRIVFYSYNGVDPFTI